MTHLGFDQWTSRLDADSTTEHWSKMARNGRCEWIRTVDATAKHLIFHLQEFQFHHQHRGGMSFTWQFSWVSQFLRNIPWHFQQPEAVEAPSPNAVARTLLVFDFFDGKPGWPGWPRWPQGFIWLVVTEHDWIIVSIHLECHHPKWRTHIFQRDSYATNQIHNYSTFFHWTWRWLRQRYSEGSLRSDVDVQILCSAEQDVFWIAVFLYYQ